MILNNIILNFIKKQLTIFLKYGKSTFFWVGPLVKDYLSQFSNDHIFTKSEFNTLLFYKRQDSIIWWQDFWLRLNENTDVLFVSTVFIFILIITVKNEDYILEKYKLFYFKIKTFFNRDSNIYLEYKNDSILEDYDMWCNDIWLQTELYWDLWILNQNIILILYNNYLNNLDYAMYFCCSF